MDERVKRAMQRWPNVPALYGWLRLDEAGRWWLNGARVRNQALFDFIGRNYNCDEAGQWFFQNGPQRGYVELDYTPWVLHLGADDRLLDQFGNAVNPTGVAVIDDEANLLLETPRGPGLFAGDGLSRVVEKLLDGDGEPVDLAAIEAAIHARDASGLQLAWDGGSLPVAFIPRAEVPERSGFVRKPVPPGTS